MIMKKSLIILVFLMVESAMNAQTILMGDMNNDDHVTIADVTSLVNVVLGKASQERINVGGSPYQVDNSMVVGTWYAPDGKSFTLNEDGTTDYGIGFTYKFRPYQGTLMMFNRSGKPVKTLFLNEVEKSYLLAMDYASGTYTYYTNSVSLVSGLVMSEDTLTINSGTTVQLSVIVTPQDAFNVSVIWSSSDESVATVDMDGKVTGVASGSCTITAKSTDGSGMEATCFITVTQLVKSITLSQNEVTLELDGFVRLTATVMPIDAANKSVIWSSSDEEVAKISRSGRVDAYDKGTAVIKCTAADGSGVYATCKIIVLDPDSYVDLGLPSGTLWATCNIGANSPEDFGDYFAWGETQSKTVFFWDTYMWCSYYNRSEGIVLINKYYDYDEKGNPGDGKSELDLEDDAAYVNGGKAWRMPSAEQIEELTNSNYTTQKKKTINGVVGFEITSKINGNSIFLPAAGSLYGDDSGSYGPYWNDGYSYLSRSVLFENCRLAYGLTNEDNSILFVGGCGRLEGSSIRPVRIPLD